MTDHKNGLGNTVNSYGKTSALWASTVKKKPDSILGIIMKREISIQ